MTLTGMIRSYSRHRDVDLHDKRLPAAWIWSGSKSTTPPGLRSFSALTSTFLRQDLNAPTLVMLSGTHDEAISNELVVHARTGARVYVLVPESWDAKGAASEILQASKVLIRRVKGVAASFIHTPHEAKVWLGGPWHLRLDAQQTRALRHVFLRQFWHEAFEEAWTGGKQLVWRATGERPFDVPDISRQAVVRMASDLRLEMPFHDAMVHLSNEVPPDEQPHTLWLRPGKDHHERLAHFVRNGTRVCWEERGLPDMVVRQTSGQVLVATGNSRLRIALNAEQAADAFKLLEASAPWAFGVDVPIAQASLQLSSFWIGGENQARALLPRQEISLKEVTASSIRLIPDTEPAKFEAPHPLALTARYVWNVLPSKAPGGTTEDPLHEQWRQVDQHWNARLDKVKERLSSAEENKGRISKAFVRLASAVLGFGRTQQSLANAVERMKKARPSDAGSSRAREMLSELETIEGQTLALQNGIEKAEADERHKIEEEKQRNEWQMRVDEARSELPRKRDALKSGEVRREELEADLDGVKEARKSAGDDEKKDLHARELSLSDEIKSIKKQLGRLRADIQTLEEKLAEPFQFRPIAEPNARSKQTSGRFVPPATTVNSNVAVPDQDLPEVGVLRVLKNKRYLVIRTWEELNAGEKAAQRLNADLVAEEKP